MTTIATTARSAILGIPTDPLKKPSRTGVVEAFEEVDAEFANVQEQIDEISEGADSVTKQTWAQLDAVVGTREGQRGYVEDDAGTHTDPVVGGTVDNQGIYMWVASPAGWQWLVGHDLDTVIADVAALDTRLDTAEADIDALETDVAAIEERVDDIPQSGPLVQDLAHAFEADDGVLLAGIQRDGQIIARNSSGIMQVLGGGAGGSLAPTTWTHDHDSAGTGNSLIVPSGGVMRMFLLYGQSYAMGTIDNDEYDAATPYNSTPFDEEYAFMPSVGLQVDTSFTSLAPLFEQKNGNGSTVETIASEWVKGVHEAWVARSLTKAPIVVCAGGDGGQPIQALGMGSDPFEALMVKVQRVVNAAAAIGLQVVCDVSCYLQGQANRSGNAVMTRHEWARAMATMQRQLEMRVRAITGQVEPIPMLLEQISRGAIPAEICLGAMLAAERSPDRIILLNPDYALEHSTTSAHPTVPGYRRLGRYAAMATVGAVYGFDYRPMIVRKHWMNSTTTLHIEIECPKGADLIKDTSSDLVNVTGLDNGAGIQAWDKNGAVTIDSVTVVSNHDSNEYSGDTNIAGTLEVTFNSAPDENSLVCQYAHGRPPGAGTGQGGLGGSYSGPRGLFRADDGAAVTDLTLPIHSWVQPFEVS